MGLFDIFSRKGKTAEPERVEPKVHNSIPLASGTYGSEFYSLLAGGLSRTGMPVNEQTAMCVSAVYSCIGLISGAIMSMPAIIYRRDKNGDAERAPDHPLWWLLNEQPRDDLSAAVFWEYLTTSLLLHGDAFAKIWRPSKYSPDIAGFEPLHPMQVQVVRYGENNSRLAYHIQREAGVIEVLDQDDVLHIPGLGFNGLRGLSPLRFALKGPAGIALAADEMSGAYFRNGGKTDIALVAPGKLDQEQVKQMRENWAENQGPLSNAYLPQILSGGVKIESLTVSAEDAQLLSTRKMQVEEICRIYRVPPFMVGYTEKTTSYGQGIEQMSIGFVKYTLNAYLIKFEHEINRKCLRSYKFFARFDPTQLERGDTAARFTAYRIGLGRAGEQPFMTVDEVRRAENLPPRDIPVNPGKSTGPDTAPEPTNE